MTVTLADGSEATVTIVSVTDDKLTFEVEGGLAAIVFVKGGNATQDDVNVYDYTGFPGGGIAHDDGLITPTGSGISHVDFCLVPVEASIIVYKTDQLGADVEGATFEVRDGETVAAGPSDTDVNGIVCFDDLVLGETYTVVETAAPDGWLPADPDNQQVTAEQGSCADRATAGDAPDATFTNTRVGSLIVLKTDDNATDPVALPDAEFTVNSVTQSTGSDGTTCFDNLIAGDLYDVTETTSPPGYDPASPSTIEDVEAGAGTCTDRADDAADVTFTNHLTEEDLGSITVVKEVECQECETRTIGYYFNAADRHAEETNALFGSGIEADGIIFTNVDQVQQYRADDQDGTSDGENGLSARGQLTIQYLAAQLNLLRNGEECDLANRVYKNPDSAFDGWTVQMILDEADLAFNGGSDYTDQQIQEALDDINNSSHEDENPLSCEGTESGTLDGVTFDIYLEANYPDGDPTDSGTTGDDGAGTLVFGGLTIGETYVLVESGFPDGMTCEIIDVQGEGFDFTLNADGSVSVTLTAEAADVTLALVNDCGGGGEEDEFDVTLNKEDQTGASMSGIEFNLTNGDDYDQTISTSGAGTVAFTGLTEGDYTLTENDTTCTNDGPWTVSVAGDGAITIIDGNDDALAVNNDGSFTIVNTCEEEEEDMVEVAIMKHLCADVNNVAEFQAIEAAAVAASPNNAFAPLVATVVACPTIILTANIPIDAAPAALRGSFQFSVVDADGTQLLSQDATFMDAKLCETTVQLDLDGDGIKADDCLDISHYIFDVEDGQVVIRETAAPANHRFGTVRFTPGSDDASTLIGSITSVEQTGVIRLDTTKDGDDKVMLHVYNFSTEDTLGGGGGTKAREGTLAGNPVPNTAMENVPVTTLPLAVLAIVLASLGTLAYVNVASVSRRR